MRSNREGNGTPLQYSCLENPMDGGAWKAAVHGVAEGRTRLSNCTFTFHFHALEKEMATHSSVLAWRTPGMGKPVGLPSMGSHRVGHNWSDLVVVVAWDLKWNLLISFCSFFITNAFAYLFLCLLVFSVFYFSKSLVCILWRPLYCFSYGGSIDRTDPVGRLDPNQSFCTLFQVLQCLYISIWI